MSFVVFVALFCIAQLSLSYHQTSHETNQSQAECLICHFTPNQIQDTSLSASFECINEEILDDQGCYEFTSSVPDFQYLSRGPPVS